MEVEDGEILEDGEINDDEDEDAGNQENKAPAFEGPASSKPVVAVVNIAVPEQLQAEDEAEDGKKDKKRRKHREKREKKRKEKSKDQSAPPGTKKRKHKHYTDYDRVPDNYVWPTSAVGTHHGQIAPESYESLFDLPQQGVGEHDDIPKKKNVQMLQNNHTPDETTTSETSDIKRSHSYDEITPSGGGSRKRQDMAISPDQEAESGQDEAHYRKRGSRKDDYGMEGAMDQQTDGSPSKKGRHTLARHVSNPADSRSGWKNTPFDNNQHKSGNDYANSRDSRQQRHRRHSRHKEQHTHSSDAYADPYDSVYQSPPGPYDSPAESPPGPYDSPPQEHEHKDKDDYHHDDIDEGRNSLLGMIGDQFVDPNIAANEREEVFKTAGRKNKNKKWNEQQQQRGGKQQKKGLLDPPTKQRARCMFYMENKCQKGNRCPFNHDFTPTKRPEICKYYVQSTCFKGEDCIFMHGEYPCKFYHTGGKCYANENCKFSHDRLTDETRQLLEKVLDHGEDAWKDHHKRLPGDGSGERRERHDRHGDDGRPGYQGDEGGRPGFQGNESRSNYQSDEGRPRPSLLGSPPRIIPSLLDIEVFPIAPKSSPLRPGGFYKDTSSGPPGPGMDGPQGPGMDGPQGRGPGGPQGPGMDGPQGRGPGGPQGPSMDGPQGRGPGGPQGPGMDGPQGRGPGGPQGPGMDGPQGRGPGMGGPGMDGPQGSGPRMGGPQGPGMDGPQGRGPGMGGPQGPGMDFGPGGPQGPGMDGPQGRGPGMGGPQGPGMDGPQGFGPGPHGPGMNGPQGRGPGMGGPQGPGMDGPQGRGPGMGGPHGPGMDGPQGRGPGMGGPQGPGMGGAGEMGGPQGHGGMGGPMMQGPGMGGLMMQGPGMGGPQGPVLMQGPPGQGGNIGMQGQGGNMGMQGQGGNMGMQGLGLNMGMQGPQGQGGMRMHGPGSGQSPMHGQGHDGPGGMQGLGQGPMSRQQGPGGMSPMHGGHPGSGGQMQMQNQGPMQGPGGGNQMQGMSGGQGPGFMQGPGQQQFQGGIPTPQQQLQAQQTGGSGMGPNFPGSGIGPFQPGSGSMVGQMGPGGGGGGVQLLGPAVSPGSGPADASSQMGRPPIDVVQGAQELYNRLFGSENQKSEASQQTPDMKAEDSHESSAAVAAVSSADEGMSSQDEGAPDLKIASNSSISDSADETHNEPKPESDPESPKKSPGGGGGMDIPAHLPRKQRELFMRIQQQQQEKLAEEAEMKEDEADTQPVDDDNWQYSSDEEESASDHSKSMLSNILKSISKKGMEKSAPAAAVAVTSMPPAVVSAAQNPAFDIMKMLNAIKQQATGTSTTDVPANSSSVPSIPLIIQPDSQPELRSPTSKGGVQFLGLSRSLAKNGELPYKLVEIAPRSKPYYYSCMPPGLDLDDARVKKDPRIARILKHLPQSDPRGAQRRPSSTGQESPRASDPRLGRQDSSGSTSSLPIDPRLARSQSASDNQTVSDPRKASPSHQQTDPRLAIAAMDNRPMTSTPLVSSMSDTGISGLTIDSKMGLNSDPTIGNIMLGSRMRSPNSGTMNQVSDPRIGPPLIEPLPLALTRLPGNLLNAKIGPGAGNTPRLTPMPSLPSLPFPPPQNFPGSRIMNPFLSGENRMSFDPRLRGALTQAQFQLQQHHQNLQQLQQQQLQQQQPSQLFLQQQPFAQQPQPPSHPFPQQQQPPSQPFPPQQSVRAAGVIDPRIQRSQSSVTLGTHNLPVRPLDPRAARSSGPPEVRLADPRVSRKPSGESLISSDGNKNTAPSLLSDPPWNSSSGNPTIVDKSANLSKDLLTSKSSDPRLGRSGNNVQNPLGNTDSVSQQQQVNKSEPLDQVSGVVHSDPRSSRKQEPENSAADPLEARSSFIQQTSDPRTIRTRDNSDVDPRSVLDPRSIIDPRSVADPRSITNPRSVADPRSGVVDPCQARTENLRVSDPRLSKSQENNVSSDIAEPSVSDSSIAASATSRLDPRRSRRQAAVIERVNIESETDSAGGQSDSSSDPRKAARRTNSEVQQSKSVLVDSLTTSTSDVDATSTSDVVHTNNNNNSENNTSSAKARIPKKKFTGKRKSSMEYSSPLGMGSDDPDPTVSGFSSYNRIGRDTAPKSHENWNTSIVSASVSNTSSVSSMYPNPPPHPTMDIIDPALSQDNQMEVMDLSSTQPPLKDLFKTIDPTASPFC